MLGLLPVPMRADEIQIGSGTATDVNLPSHSYYKYSLTQQIYTATEIEAAGGSTGTINSIAFYNGGTTKTRNFSIYLVNTDKMSFANSSDWITVTTNDLVYSGNVEMTANEWTTITFSTPFSYDGGNLAVIVDDNTGNDVNGMKCLSFTASATQSIYYRNDSTNPDPTNPTISGTPVTTKNQIILDIEMSAVSCSKPKSFTATSVTAHTATLTWQPGAEGQSNWDVYVTTTASDVPDENTTPTWQVTECSKTLDNLTTQTTYYAYVRSVCGGEDGNSKWASTNFTTTRESVIIDAENPYTQDFEENNDWTFSNGTFVNQWWWGNATNSGGEKSIYISDDNGVSNNYTHSSLVVYASKLFSFGEGTYTFSFDWNAKGESSYDFIRVALAPGDKTFTAGGSMPAGTTSSSLPSGWIALDGGSKLNLSDSWQTKVTETALSGTYTMVFLWRNDGGGGNQPPAAIDNISISYMTCPRPTNLTASNITGRTAIMTWRENGTATNWTLQYATDAAFTTNLVEISDGFVVSGNNVGAGLTGLSGETTYYVRVKSILGNEESSWSDVCNFTTTATCEKPTLNYAYNSTTAHTASVNWTGDADNYELIYSTAYSFNPGDPGVIQIDLGNVNTYTLQDLTPETTYRVKVRANCGAEDGYSQWSNQISFTTTATCVAPSGLSATATSSTVTLSWTANAEGQDAWDIRYKASTDNEYTYIHLDNQTTTNYTITGLSPVTTYSVNVRAYCSEEDQSKWGYSSYNQNSDLSISTACGAVALPYFCDFEGDLNTSSPYSTSYPMPRCWTRSGNQSNIPYVLSATYSQPYNHGETSTSGHYLRFYRNADYYDAIAVLPAIDEQYQIADLQIRFWARLENYNSGKDLAIGIMTDPADRETFVTVETVTVNNPDNSSLQSYKEYTVTFDNYQGEGRYIAIRQNTSMYAIYVDDVTVEAAPSCRIPNDLEAETTDSQATLTWTAGNNETSWNIQYKKASNEEWSEPILVDTTTYTMTGLRRATVYNARVQAVCSDEDQSDWAEISFTTECGIWPIDAENGLFEDFENVEASDFPPVCWNKFSHEMSGYNYWYLNSNNGLGSSAAYSYWNNGYAFLVMPQMHINGNATLSFDYLIGSGNYDESCSVVVSTNEMTFDDFSQTIWTAEDNYTPSVKSNATVSLADFDGEDIYIAFKFKGSGTSGCTWYVDNIEVYVPATQTIELAQGWNWWSPTVEITLTELETSLGANGITIKSQNSGFVDYDDDDEEWSGNLSALVPGQMYKIQVSNDCEFVHTAKALYTASITIEHGHNWFGYIGQQALTIEQALNGFTPTEGDRINSFDGKFANYEDGEWNGNLGHLQPGQGYVYISQDTDSKPLILTRNEY